MAIVEGPVLLERFEIHSDVRNPNNLVLVLTATDGTQYGVPLTQASASRMSEELAKAATKFR